MGHTDFIGSVAFSNKGGEGGTVISGARKSCLQPPALYSWHAQGAHASSRVPGQHSHSLGRPDRCTAHAPEGPQVPGQRSLVWRAGRAHHSLSGWVRLAVQACAARLQVRVRCRIRDIESCRGDVQVQRSSITFSAGYVQQCACVEGRPGGSHAGPWLPCAVHAGPARRRTSSLGPPTASSAAGESIGSSASTKATQTQCGVAQQLYILLLARLGDLAA